MNYCPVGYCHNTLIKKETRISLLYALLPDDTPLILPLMPLRDPEKSTPSFSHFLATVAHIHRCLCPSLSCLVQFFSRAVLNPVNRVNIRIRQDTIDRSVLIEGNKPGWK